MDKIMDNIMPSYSFSHQFYQHWTETPSSVRAAIVDELSDIIDLLHPETALAEFRFTQPDLDAHIDLLYGEHYAHLAQKEAEQVRLKQEQQDAEATKQSVSAPVTPEYMDTENTESTQNDDDSAAPTVTDTQEAESLTDQAPTDTATKTQADSVEPINTAFADALIQELGTHIDDYLSEQMAQISEDLKSWLRDEIARQLSGVTPKNP